MSLNTEMSAGRDSEIMLENTADKTPLKVISPTVPLVIGSREPSIRTTASVTRERMEMQNGLNYSRRRCIAAQHSPSAHTKDARNSTDTMLKNAKP